MRIHEIKLKQDHIYTQFIVIYWQQNQNQRLLSNIDNYLHVSQYYQIGILLTLSEVLKSNMTDLFFIICVKILQLLYFNHFSSILLHNNLIHTMIPSHSIINYNLNSLDSYTSITVKILTKNKYKMQVRMPTLNKTKYYNGTIISYCFKKQRGLCCPTNYKHICLKHVILFILKFPLRILHLQNGTTEQLFKTYESLQNFLQRQQFSEKTESIGMQSKISISKLFTQILLRSLSELKICLEMFCVESIVIYENKTTSEIVSILEWIEFINMINWNFHLTIHMESKQICIDLIDILKIWSRKIPAGYDYELLLVRSNNQQLLRVVHFPQFGYYFHLSVNSRKFINKFIKDYLLLKLDISQQFISVQIDNIFPGFVSTIKSLFKSKTHKSYLLKIGNQIQLTSFSLLLNSNGLTDNQFAQIIELMRLPGRYEMTCYSQYYFFNVVCHLFFQKPLIRFDYFEPLDNLSEQRLQFINKMCNFALQCRKKVYSFIALKKTFQILQISNNTLLNTFFMSFKQ